MEDCYQCLRPSILSPRSRCVNCEYRRAKANEEENEQLREELEALKEELQQLKSEGV